MPINPETLKALRGSRSQQWLAETANVARKTISRIEGGEVEKVRPSIVQKLAKALETTPEALSREPSEAVDAEQLLRSHGFRIEKLSLEERTGTSMALVEHRYGVSVQRQAALAPLLFTIFVKMSKRARRLRLAELEEAGRTLSGLVPPHLQHIHLGTYRVEDALADERTSIEADDIFGTKIQEAAAREDYGLWPFEPDETNPFMEFVRATAKELGMSLADEEGEEPMLRADGLPEAVCVFHDQLAGICGDNVWAKRAIAQGFAKIAEVPSELWHEARAEDRAEWFENKYPVALRQKYEAEMAEIFGRLSAAETDGGKND